MASNQFGTHFRITTWGESHGKAMGVVIDGCPANLSLSEDDIQKKLELRRGGKTAFVTPRKEEDRVEILSGVFEGRTTGAPISLMVWNRDVDSSKYKSIKDLYRPGHANFTYLQKYGIFDYRGGGRASARETLCRVAAGAIAEMILEKSGIVLTTSLVQMHTIKAPSTKNRNPHESAIFCADLSSEKSMVALLKKAKEEGDSLGGVVELIAENLPVGLGDPVYEKLEAKLASAMLSIPASKGFEIGEGMGAASMQGSHHNDIFHNLEGDVRTKTNHAGGTLGGISNGMPLVVRVAFKPTSSIKKLQETLSTDNQLVSFSIPEGSRHDPCIAIRAVPVVQAMGALVLVDCLLANRLCKL